MRAYTLIPRASATAARRSTVSAMPYGLGEAIRLVLQEYALGSLVSMAGKRCDG
jgi:hypothetical protein